jgi:hypothetical protein
MRRLLAASLTLCLASIFPAAPACAQDGTRAPAPAEYEWVVYYYMAYDNNLEKCGRPILDMIKSGITNDKVAVVVSADFRDTKGMQRFVLTQGKERVTQLTEEGSAEEETLAAELKWVRQNLRAKKYAVVFLNHGGALGQMSYDEQPGKEGGQKWLYPPHVAKALTQWRKQIKPSEVELVFYQQCGKGSVENYHAMRTAARYVMGSQTVVGAPNHYYKATLSYLCQNPGIDGKELAKTITRTETPNMFTTYSTFSSKKLGDLPKRLDATLEPLLKLGEIKLPRGIKPCFDFGRREMFFDGLHLLRGLYTANALDPAPVEAFAKWISSDLITSHRVSPLKQKKAGDWCGFSIFFPVNPRLLTQYKDYPIYGASKIDEFYTSLFKQVSARRAAARAAEKKKKEKAGKP